MNNNNAPQQTPAAVALKYDGEQAPIISAAGSHQLADEIIRIAREHGVPLYENAELASTLAQLSLNDEIPEQLYQLVAEILAFAFHIRGLTPQDAGKQKPESDRKP